MDSEQTHVIAMLVFCSCLIPAGRALEWAQSICGAGTGGARARAGNASNGKGARDRRRIILVVCPASNQRKKGLADLDEEANSVVCNLIRRGDDLFTARPIQ